MNLILLDLNFEAVAMVDTYESFIWTDRFNACGDFEFFSKASQENFDLFKQGYYLWLDESEHLMIIESIETLADTEDGNNIRVIGRSLESILDRRVIWEQTNITGSFQNAIKTILNDSILKPKIAERKIPNFIFEESTDPRIVNLAMEDSQFTGDNVYDVITNLCQEFRVGYKIVLDDKKNFVFSLYLGTDRTDEQTENIAVIFSNNFDNIINSSYIDDISTYKNLALVAGEGTGISRKTAVVGDQISSGIDRRELFVDARDISSNSGTTTISAAKYTSLLIKRGETKLSENDVRREFDGKVVPDGLFKYGIDYFLGDLVHFYDDYGNGSRVRVDTMVFTWDDSEKTSYPTFVILDKNNKEI